MHSLLAPFYTISSWCQERDERRGFSLSHKRLGLAFLAETTIVVASLYGAWYFANQYGEPKDLWAMMLAPIGYAVIEFCRVPLALSVRTQSSYVIKIIALIGVIAAAGVTVKSMSQLGELMFRPRLKEVMDTRIERDKAIGLQTSLAAKISDADKIVAEQEETRKGAERRAMDAAVELGKLPPQKTVPHSYRDRRSGRVIRTTRTVTDPRTATLDQNVKLANAEVAEVVAKLDAARAERAKLDRDAVDQKVIETTGKYENAVKNSQLHSFTAMVFAKDPTQVTDSEIHEFLRVFVFLPAILVSLASTLLALTSVEKIKRKLEEGPVALPVEATQYILGPYATEIYRDAVKAAEKTAQDALEKAKPQPGLKVVGGDK